MALPSSGSISLSQVNVELGRSATASINKNESAVRTLFGVASGAISMSQGYGKANQFAFSIASNQTNANLRTLAVNAGWNQSSSVVATINGGVYLSSNGTGTPGLTIDGSFPNGVSLTNNGFIVGMGGAGGKGGGANNATPVAGAGGSGGGLALLASVGVSITNNGTIAGGGGGGGGGQGGTHISSDAKNTFYYVMGAGGGGGGRSSAAANSSGGAAGTAIKTEIGFLYPGNPGGAGTSSGQGGGGAGRSEANIRSGAGGDGGGWGASGGSGGTGAFLNAGTTAGPYGGGSGGAAVNGNGNITWLATGTRLGAIS
jgi:hypothetical protein